MTQLEVGFSIKQAFGVTTLRLFFDNLLNLLAQLSSPFFSSSQDQCPLSSTWNWADPILASCKKEQEESHANGYTIGWLRVVLFLVKMFELSAICIEKIFKLPNQGPSEGENGFQLS